MIHQNVEYIKRRISSVCERCGRSPGEVTLVAVSKTFSTGHIREAVQAGVADIGENYVQELLGKRNTLEDQSVRWHFIGHLQSNKVKYIADWIHLVHAVDAPGVVSALEKHAARTGRIVDVLVEVNTTREGSKYGVEPERTTDFIRSLAAFEHVRIAGLMTIGPFLPDPEASRPMFRTLRLLRDQVRQLGQRNVSMIHLSMGMTGDFEVAIEEGATLVRIGTAIFGARKSSE